MMEYIPIVVAFIAGYLLGTNKQQKESDAHKAWESYCKQLEKDIGYYKDLCQWHVEEKEKNRQYKEYK